MAQEPPRQVGPYAVVDRLGVGGMGVVYRARDTRTGQIVAVKVMRTELAQNFSFVRRFQREARIAQDLDSPNIVRVLDAGGDGDTRYIAMEYVEGRTLKALLRESGPLAPGDAEDIAVQVARGLAVAHSKGIVHRDISPENVMLTADGTVKIADFGVARGAGYSTVTMTGAFIGKPSYAAPETMGGSADIRSDIYSLGVVLFEMLTGRPPFAAPTPVAVMEMHARDPVPRLREMGVRAPAYVEEIMLRCLRKNAAERYQAPAELAVALQRRDAGQAPAVAATSVTTVATQRLEPPPPPPPLLGREAKPQGGSPVMLAAVGLVGAAIVAASAIGFVMMTRGDDGNGPPAAASGQGLTTRPAASATLPTAGVTPEGRAAPIELELTGAWRIENKITAEDTEEFGGHVGDCNAFTVEIRQTQDRFVGEGDLVALQGTIAGGKVNASFVQEHLDITGEFAWTVGDGGDSLDGTFTSHLSDGGSNSGESTVERLDVAPTSTEPC